VGQQGKTAINSLVIDCGFFVLKMYDFCTFQGSSPIVVFMKILWLICKERILHF